MRIRLPPRRLCRHVVDLLHDSYDAGDRRLCAVALAELAAHYATQAPRVTWVRRPRAARDALGVYLPAHCEIRLVHPDWWERRATENTADEWVATAIHEAYHAMTTADEERRADDFAEAVIARR